ncbi:hypothetical protein [Chromohalobacter moromii]|uniref:Uncharacterized protein n=1 Tax=Chromohalobacter moromii TaxID=2860329 RepID=A0A9X2X459_9GAMM|nr:hypothetical protein [Chromohalobacter moromii]MCT8506166.1 hypothetical protein [Chromohalobacter moromii]
MAELDLPYSNQDYRQRWEHLYTNALSDSQIRDRRPNHEENQRLHLRAAHHFIVEAYADELKQRLCRTWWDLSTLDVLAMRAVAIHHWHIEYAKGLSIDELAFALHDEIAHFKLPDPAYRVLHGKLQFWIPHPTRALEPHRGEETQPPNN